MGLPTHPPSTYTGSKSRPAPKAENAPPESSHRARRLLRRRSLGQVLADRAGLRIFRGVVDAHCHQSQELGGSHSRGDVPKKLHEKVVGTGKEGLSYCDKDYCNSSNLASPLVGLLVAALV